MRHPWLTAGTCTAVLVLAALPALRMRAAMPDTTTFPKGSEIRNVDERLADPAQFDPSGASSLQIVLETEGPVLEPENLRRVQAYIEALAQVPGVATLDTALDGLDPNRVDAEGLVTTTDPDLLTELDRTVDGDLTLINAQGTHSFRANAAGDTVHAVRALPHPGRRVEVAGPTAALVDVNNTLRSHAPLVGALVLAWNLGVLFSAFRSILVPLKAAVMNVLSLGASFGVLVWVFQDGNLAGLLGFEPPGGIEPTIPLILAAVIFGLSMDYEVFLLSRIQEEYRRDGDNMRSIVAGLAHTGRVIIERRVDPAGRDRRLRGGRAHLREGDRRRNGRGDRARRDAGPRAAGAGDDAPDGPLELVVAELARRRCRARARGGSPRRGEVRDLICATGARPP